MKKKITSLIFTMSAIALASSVFGEEVILREGPPAAIEEVVPARPGPNHVWIGGHWGREAGRWVWIKGYWKVPPGPSAHWIPGHWNQGPRGWHWVDGHWS